MGIGIGEEVPSPADYEVWGSRELPSRVRGGSPAANTFSALFECRSNALGEQKMQYF